MSAAASKTRYYLSLDTVRNSGDKLLSGSRSVPILASGASSTGAITVTVPTNTALGNYYMLACADDTTNVDESNETNNCKASANRISIARPDLVETALSNPPPSAAPGGSFAVTDTVQNQAAVAAGSSTTRYYLSLDSFRSNGDIRLTGSRSGPALGAGASSPGTVTVTIPTSVSPASYYVLACADDTTDVTESNEANNCRSSVSLVAHRPVARLGHSRRAR